MIMMNFNIMNSNMINSNTSLQKVAARSAWPGVLLLRAALAAPQLLQVRSISTSEEFFLELTVCNLKKSIIWSFLLNLMDLFIFSSSAAERHKFATGG